MCAWAVFASVVGIAAPTLARAACTIVGQFPLRPVHQSSQNHKIIAPRYASHADRRRLSAQRRDSQLAQCRQRDLALLRELLRRRVQPRAQAVRDRAPAHDFARARAAALHGEREHEVVGDILAKRWAALSWLEFVAITRQKSEHER